jgi:Domain of unknown function (DUF4304)
MLRQISSRIEDVFSSSAIQQHQSASRKFAGLEAGVEPARDVYLSACAEIGRAMQPLGFRYAKSSQRCSKSTNDFTFVISFQSSHNNVSGHHVRLWMHATVKSKALQRWRAEYLPSDGVNDHVAGGMVHRLKGVHAMVEWELADSTGRHATIEDATSFIHTDVLPYFKAFEDPAAVIESLTQREVPAFDLTPSVEFAICFGSPRYGQQVLDRFLRSRPDLQGAILAAELEGRPKLPYGPANFAESVAFLRRTYSLQ